MSLEYAGLTIAIAYTEYEIESDRGAGMRIKSNHEERSNENLTITREYETNQWSVSRS